MSARTVDDVLREFGLESVGEEPWQIDAINRLADAYRQIKGGNLCCAKLCACWHAHDTRLATLDAERAVVDAAKSYVAVIHPQKAESYYEYKAAQTRLVAKVRALTPTTTEAQS